MVKLLIIIFYAFLSTLTPFQKDKKGTELIIVWEFSYEEDMRKDNFTFLGERFESLFKEEYNNIENIVLADKEKLDSVYSK